MRFVFTYVSRIRLSSYVCLHEKKLSHPLGSLYLAEKVTLHAEWSTLITRGASGPMSFKMGFFHRRVAILQTIRSSPIGFAKRAQIHVLLSRFFPSHTMCRLCLCEYWRVFFRPRKSEMWLASVFILTRLNILTITYADRSRPTLHEPFRNGLVCDLDINCTLRCTRANLCLPRANLCLSVLLNRSDLYLNVLLNCAEKCCSNAVNQRTKNFDEVNFEVTGRHAVGFLCKLQQCKSKLISFLMPNKLYTDIHCFSVRLHLYCSVKIIAFLITPNMCFNTLVPV